MSTEPTSSPRASCKRLRANDFSPLSPTLSSESISDVCHAALALFLTQLWRVLRRPDRVYKLERVHSRFPGALGPYGGGKVLPFSDLLAVNARFLLGYY